MSGITFWNHYATEKLKQFPPETPIVIIGDNKPFFCLTADWLRVLESHKRMLAAMQAHHGDVESEFTEARKEAEKI